MPEVKQCRHCQQIKPLTAFRRCRRIADGRRHICQQCQKKRDYMNSVSQGIRQLTVRFDAYTIEDIDRYIARTGKTYSEAVRELVEWGLMEVRRDRRAA